MQTSLVPLIPLIPLTHSNMQWEIKKYQSKAESVLHSLLRSITPFLQIREINNFGRLNYNFAVSIRGQKRDYKWMRGDRLSTSTEKDHSVILHTSHTPKTPKTPCLDLFPLSDDRNLAETRKTMVVAQRTCIELGEKLYIILQDKTEMQIQVIALKSQFQQMEEAHQAQLQLLEIQIELETQQLARLQEERDEMVRVCNENITAISLQQQLALDMATQANQEQIDDLEHTQTNAVAVLKQMHTNTRTVVQQTHAQALMDMQNRVNEATHQCGEAERMAVQKEQETQHVSKELSTAKTNLQAQSQAVSYLKMLNSYGLGWL